MIKSLGPDEFNLRFLKSFWETIKVDVQKMVEELYQFGTWPKGCIASFITLIPKVKSPQGLGEFRPISLLGCMFKIIAMLLARCLKEELPKVIDRDQSTFLGWTSL